MNRWVGHRLVDFASDMCQNCGNERLRHLHQVKVGDEGHTNKKGIYFDAGTILEVGCYCAANLCPSQDEPIHRAEREMDKEDARLKQAEKLKASWKARRKKGNICRVIGQLDGYEFTVYWAWGLGWTTDLPNAPIHPEPRGYEWITMWIEKLVINGEKKIWQHLNN